MASADAKPPNAPPRLSHVRRTLVVSAGTTLLAVLAPLAHGAILHRHTPAGMRLAAHVLIQRRNLGPGWSIEAPAPRRPPSLTCSRFHPAPSGVTETGAAASPTFRGSASGPFVSQEAWAYATVAQQGKLWSTVVRPKLLRCLAESLTQGSSQGVTFTVTGQHLLSLPRLPAKVAGYRVAGVASQSGASNDVYLDMIVLGRGQAISAITFSSFEQPPSRRLERRLARVVAHGMSTG